MIRFWWALIILTSLVSIWFSCVAALRLQEYFSLRESSLIQNADWKVVALSESGFGIQAKFYFVNDGNLYFGTSILQGIRYINSSAAQAHIEEISKRPWKAWYRSSNPTINSLQKKFPFKACIQVILTWAVVLYFSFIKKYLLKVSS